MHGTALPPFLIAWHPQSHTRSCISQLLQPWMWLNWTPTAIMWDHAVPDRWKKKSAKNHIEQKSNVLHLQCESPAITLHARISNLTHAVITAQCMILYVILLHSQYPQTYEKILLASASTKHSAKLLGHLPCSNLCRYRPTVLGTVHLSEGSFVQRSFVRNV